MPDIRLDRTFWPVGHGAFYTERFYDHAGKRVFTAIYDCGSGRRWGKTSNGANDASPKTVQQLIESFLPSQKTPNGVVVKDIDIAFVSHLHVDHINGLPTLLPRIKILVLPSLSDCRLLDAFLYNSIPEDVRNGEVPIAEISDDSRADVESDVQSFILRLANGEVENTVQVVPNDGEPPIDPIDLERLDRDITSGSAIRVPLPVGHNAFWIYKPVDADACSDDVRNAIIGALQQHVPTGSIVDDAGKINWSKVREAVENAGLKAVIAIYETVFEIKDSSQHNNYSMPVYSGPDDSINVPHDWRHMDIHMDTFEAHGYIHSWCDIYPHPHHGVQIPLGIRCKLLSCLYMGDFNAKDDDKFSRLQKLLGGYYNRVGLQQVPHHFSDGNHRAELYKGPLIAFGNISGKKDRSYKQSVFDDIMNQGCNPIIITKDRHDIVTFDYYMRLH